MSRRFPNMVRPRAHSSVGETITLAISVALIAAFALLAIVGIYLTYPVDL